MNMKFVTLSPEEFEKFTSSHFSHYTQSRIHFENRNELKGDVHVVGVKDDSDNVIAATLMTEARALKVFKYFIHIVDLSWTTAILNWFTFSLNH